MGEASRQAYLRAMGVQVYFPRYALEGAKASPEYDFPDAPELSVRTAVLRETVPHVTSPTTPSVPSTNKEIPRFRSKNPDRPVIDVGTHAKGRTKGGSAGEKPVSSEGKAAPAKVAAGEQVARAGMTDAGSLRFDLGYFMTARGVAILYEIPPMAKDEDKARAKKLLSAILLACGLNVASDTIGPVHETFNWPLENNLGLSSSDQAGAAALAGFIRRRHDGDRFDELIVFAGVVEPLMAEIGLSMPYRQALLASLSAMLSFPSLKREVWADLQPILARIKAHSL